MECGVAGSSILRSAFPLRFFFAALLAHAWIGVRDVILDYVHPVAIRFFALAVLALGLTGAGFWVIHVLWATPHS